MESVCVRWAERYERAASYAGDAPTGRAGSNVEEDEDEDEEEAVDDEEAVEEEAARAKGAGTYCARIARVTKRVDAFRADIVIK